ncbi:PREDICTED: dual specificity protein kinase shkC-like isoform X2 [Acropora digitifera]|uniref:dual specificity protein kinase shkC-like isoform X2 n=1 Tax=Acropora digitifera TaxID=70779 RepID=UPI00077AE98C|nr:PREDICTED: dual specificity protein kinase shkC-like isoform X2 [Acropora digitifera]
MEEVIWKDNHLPRKDSLGPKLLSSLGQELVIESKLQAMSTSYVNVENTTDAMTSQIQDDGQESQDNHSILRKRTDVRIIYKLAFIKGMEETGVVIEGKEFVLEKFTEKKERLSQELQEKNIVLESKPTDWIIRRDEVIISETVLGTGAWGKVYQGSFRGNQVAVKQIHDLILSSYNRRLFEREMSIASRCRHPNLLHFMGATNNDGRPLFVTELLDTDLRKVLSQCSLHLEEIMCLALDVATALNYLHLNKPFPIIHRDISSSNVLLWRRDGRWRAKLSDNGAASFMRQWMTPNPGARIYAAPEALTSQASPKADVYSFGLLLCEMCIREVPVPQQIQEQIGLVTNGVLRELVMRCVMRDPDARPTMNDVITVLTQQAETLNAQGLVTF